MRINILKIFVFTFFLITFNVHAQAEGVSCTEETIASCYEQAKAFYSEGQFEESKNLFEKIVALDPHYKQSTGYLKKSYNHMAKETIARSNEARRQKESEQRQQQKEQRAMEKAEKAEARQVAMTHKKESTESSPVKEEEVQEEIREQYVEGTEPPKAPVYLIGVGDVLEISVWRNPDLDKSVIVRPDGILSYPLVGDIAAAGITLVELDEKITRALKDFIRVPEVSIAVQKFGGTKVIVLGEIKGPGIYSVPGGGNVIDVIAMAGGFNNDSLKHATLLIRGGLAHPQVYRLNVARILKGDLSQNIAIASNDIIYVPKKFMANFNAVLAQITPLFSTVLLGTTAQQELRGSLDGQTQ
ncbi:MAG: polysaccharide biosynthesis/export family protein [Deltaproteobacteria bacterium]|nr:polysaccharide biosynthesis/export family protein [Deltaproteobacteria bacterium]